ncbi:hypothetical protein QRD42_17675 [Enterobacter sp. PGRG2]|nr:hypothetical protein [Enterobacter sp. PGRG2]WJD49069.1 hypothetical protein QRD42_17675 [Enterobacter sp. PGRG2]
MKKLMMIAIITGLVTSNAYAINASFRKQLEKSGCTQVTEANGTCDINKTKAQNKKSKSEETKNIRNK